MADALLVYLRQTLPDGSSSVVESYLRKLEQGEYQEVLESSEARALLGDDDGPAPITRTDRFASWSDAVFHRLGNLLSDRSRSENQVIYFCIGYAALLAFVQSNVTGPPLPFSSACTLLPRSVSENRQRTEEIQHELLFGLGIDGIAPYQLTPNIELLCLAELVMTCPPILKNVKVARWAKLRVAFLQQRLLSEVSSTLQNIIYDDLDLLADELKIASDRGIFVEFLLERSAIHIHHGLDKFARADLDEAKHERHFDFALTGVLGKRTKFQEKEVSQLVVLAKSDEDVDVKSGDQLGTGEGTKDNAATNPAKLDLNDDTLLESISFSKKTRESTSTNVQGFEALPASLQALDPTEQPKLQPLDSIILLSLASSITNTSPENGLTREETLPYATRVLEGGSSNWQIYTQALLVRSRIEGFRSRTVERGLLQLQTLVDQVIAETASGLTERSENSTTQASTFLPRAKTSEDAPITERLRYIFQIVTPFRWELESELAARWVQLGGLRSALEIYERLHLWAEAALCWAATEREDKARRILRKQLFHASTGDSEKAERDLSKDEEWQGPARSPPPPDAPRLYCILGDMDQSVEMYEKAWEVSKQHYARAQRSLGRHYFATHNYVKAAEAYSKSLNINQLNHSSWFALGCTLLELGQFEKASQAFSRCIQLDETDAEAYSNFAAALLRIDPTEETQGSAAEERLDDEDSTRVVSHSKAALQKNRQDALKALKRAAALKHDSYRIWDNVLTVSASLSPPDYATMLTAQKSILDLRSLKDGEKAIDAEILDLLVAHMIALDDVYDPSKPGLTRMIVRFIDESIVPLVTGSARLWEIVAKVALWRNKPGTALDAEEKAWRATTNQPAWETESEQRWNEVVESTVRLCDSYESLGSRERTEGLSAGEPVMKDWKFKARSAIRNTMSRGKDTWDGTDGWDRLKQALDNLRG